MRRLLGDRSYDALREALELLSEPIEPFED